MREVRFQSDSYAFSPFKPRNVPAIFLSMSDSMRFYQRLLLCYMCLDCFCFRFFFNLLTSQGWGGLAKNASHLKHIYIYSLYIYIYINISYIVWSYIGAYWGDWKFPYWVPVSNAAWCAITDCVCKERSSLWILGRPMDDGSVAHDADHQIMWCVFGHSEPHQKRLCKTRNVDVA